MKKIFLFSLILFAFSVTAQADEYVNGYYKSNGTYVQPYYRTSPDSNRFNNYSTQGNTNPHTGQRGYESPYGGNNYGDSGHQKGFSDGLMEGMRFRREIDRENNER